MKVVGYLVVLVTLFDCTNPCVLCSTLLVRLRGVWVWFVCLAYI